MAKLLSHSKKVRFKVQNPDHFAPAVINICPPIDHFYLFHNNALFKDLDLEKNTRR